MSFTTYAKEGSGAQTSGDLSAGAPSPYDGMKFTSMSPTGGLNDVKNVTTSISLFDTITEALESKINITLSNASLTAENLLGENSHAVAAHLGEENGYLIYNILVLAPERSFNRILVDPGNGTVILSEELSKQQLMRQAAQPSVANLPVPPVPSPPSPSWPPTADMLMKPSPPTNIQ